jgi:hypothetical protein
VEPVRYPTPVARVTQTGRVKRGQPREDSGRGSAFARQLRRNAENSEDVPRPPAEEPEEAEDAAAAEAPATGGHPASKKRIDIRV